MAEGKEPIAQQLNSIISILDEIAFRALDPRTYDEIVAEERTLGTILTRTQLILGFINTQEYRTVRGRR